MSNIRIDLEATVINGQTLTFKSPVDCSQITGLILYYPEGNTTKSTVFQFADAHGNNVGNINLFAENVLVKVILDTDLKRAYVQNADTNAYLESRFANLKASDVGALSTTGGTMNGPINMGGNVIWGLGNPTGYDQAVPYRMFLDGLDTKLSLSGGVMQGSIDMNGKVIYNVPTPTGWGDAVNKGFLTDHGVCGEGAYISDCNKALESGFYKWDVGCANSPFDFATMFVSGRYGDSCNQIAICNAGSDRGKIVARAVDSSGASPWVPLDGSNSAPAGYGWGEYPFYPADTNIDNIPHKNCAVRMDGNPLPGVWIGHYTTVDHMSGYLRMVAMNGQYKGCVITRTRIVYVWDEWEWEVPPLDAPLIENKTTERYNSQAVYQLRVEMGVLATEYVEVAHGATFSKIVEINAIAVDESRNVSFPIAYTANDNVQDMGVYVDGTNITIHNPQLLNAYKATVILKYVK